MELLTRIAQRQQTAEATARRDYREILGRAEEPLEDDDARLLECLLVLGKTAADLPTDRDILAELNVCEEIASRLPDLLVIERKHHAGVRQVNSEAELALQQVRDQCKADLEQLLADKRQAMPNYAGVRRVVRFDLPRVRRQAEARGLIDDDDE